MKILKIVFVSLLMILICLFLSLSAYLHFYGKDKLVEVLQVAFKRPVSIASLSYSFPVGFSARKVSIEGVISVDKMIGQINVDSLKSQSLQLSTLLLDAPIYMWDRSKKETVIDVGQEKNKDVELGSDQALRQGFGLDLRIENFYIRNGHLTVVGVFPSSEMTIVLDQMWAEAQEVLFPFDRDQNLSFLASAELSGDDNLLNSGQVNAQGWINISRKNMLVDFVVDRSEPDVKIKMNLDAKNNDLKVNGDMSWGDFPLGETLMAAEEEPPVSATVLDVLSKWDVRVGSKFSFETKMDDFQVEDIQFSGQIETK